MERISPVYIYNATVAKVVDGDTVDLSIALGFKVTMALRVRLARINAAEMHDPRTVVQDTARKTKARLAELLKDPAVTIRSNKPYSEDKYGRWIAEIYTKDGKCVNDILLDEKLVKLYPDKF